MNGRAWTEDDLRRLRELYPDRRTAEVAEILRRSLSNTYAAAARMGLKKSEAFRNSPESGRIRKGHHDGRGRAYRFQKGAVPANKGLRRPGWAPGRMAETQFQRGCRSGIAARNWRPIGTILPDSDGYLRIKVREAVHGKEPTGFGNQMVWPFLSRHTWEQQNGPVPPSHTIAFKDGNRQNCAIENLECVSRAEMARRNRMWGRYPRDLAEAIHANGQLKRRLRNLEVGANG